MKPYRTFKTRLTRCGHCGHEMNRAKHTAGPAGKPHPGDITLCVECERWNTVQIDGSLKASTDDEIQRTPARWRMGTLLMVRQMKRAHEH